MTGVISGLTVSDVNNAHPAVAAEADPAPLNLTKSGQYHIARARLANNIKIEANATTAVTVAGVGGLPASGLASVAVNISAKGDWFNNGSLKIYPSGLTEPNATALNYNSNFYLADMLTTKVGADGKINIINKSNQPVKVYLDVQGYTLNEENPYVTKGSTYVPLNPLMLVTNQNIDGNGNFELAPLGQSGIPGEGVDAVALNISTLSPRDSGTLRVYPSDEGWPLDATIDFVPNRKLQNSVIAKVGTNGKINIHNFAMGATSVWVEVTGYFATAGTVPDHLALNAVDPTRVSNEASLPAGGDQTLKLTQVGGVPADADGVGINLTAKSDSGAGALQVYPAGTANPGSQTVSYQAGNQISGFTFAKLGTDGQITIHNAGSASVTVSVDAYSYTKLVPEVEPTDAVMPMSGGTYLTSVAEVPTQDCRVASEATGTALGDNCVSGTELTVGPESDIPSTPEGTVVPSPPFASQPRSTVGVAARWKYRKVVAHSCYSTKRPRWGNGSGWKCSVAKSKMTGEFKYNGSRVYINWYDCVHSDNYLAEITQTWCGWWNNGAGASGGTRYMNIGFNAKVSYMRYVARPYWLRIDAWPSGKVSLRGGS
ncbi:hypothetical protein [Actinomadura formosensis]|uniref:hypothetical protein n=1 Tax=Actinomadura formosensis TaxID=60706 RepID=UPI003D8E940E